jgi:diacylglycerol O-acyltransferase / wax synthase
MVSHHAHAAVSGGGRPVDRVSPADLMQFALGGAGAAGRVGAVLVLDTGPGFSVAEARRLLGDRIRAIPRLRQRLRMAPPGCGRPFWADDPAFDVSAHVRQIRCPRPGDERALLDVAAAQLKRALPRGRPLWSAVFVTGLAGGGTGLVIVMDHVLADGVAGLAMLGRLVDEFASPPDDRAGEFPVPAPGLRALAADAWAGRLRRLADPAASLRRFRRGVAELGDRPPRGLPPTSLNKPTGPERRLDVVTADLAAVRALGQTCGGTVNDVVLAAVAGALRALLASRGEDLPQVTVSVVVSARGAAARADGQLGNQVGVMPVTVPADGGLGTRVTRVAAITRERKSRAHGESATLLVPGFLLLARTGLLRWFVNHQRLVQTFVTNLRGPEEQLTFVGMPVRAVIPIPATTGNVPVTFGVLSYAGTLRITILSDPGLLPDAPALAAALRAEFDAIVRMPA